MAVYREQGALKMFRATVESPTGAAHFVGSTIDAAASSPREWGPRGIDTFQGRLMLVDQNATQTRFMIARTRTPSAPGDWETVNATSATPGFAWEVRPDGAGRHVIVSAFINMSTTSLVALELR